MLNLPRHNGVVIEPIDQDRAKSEAGSDEEGASPKQKPKSRNGTTPDTPSVAPHPQGIPHTLPFPPNSHYYRQHTMPTGKAHYSGFQRALFHSQLGGQDIPHPALLSTLIINQLACPRPRREEVGTPLPRHNGLTARFICRATTTPLHIIDRQ